jgi:hypothetical protein
VNKKEINQFRTNPNKTFEQQLAIVQLINKIITLIGVLLLVLS